MTVINLVRSEFARLISSRMGLISLIALMCVPIVYGGLYLYGNKDPYANLEQVPAALVVNDRGAMIDGTATNYGEKAAKQLLKDKDFGWVKVSSAEAKKGIDNGTYDFGITFPASFTKDLSSASGDDPSAAKLVLTTNDTNSYLSTTIAKQAAEAVRVQLAKQVGEKASSTLLNSIGSIRDGLLTADDGAKQLSDGAAAASTGATSLASGAAALTSGLAQLDSKAAALPSSTAQLSAGATKVSNGLAQLNSGVQGQAALIANAQKAATDAQAYQSQVRQQLLDAGVDPALVGQVDGELVKLVSATNGAATGAAALNQLSAGAAQVSAGASQLNTSAPALAKAVHSAATGASGLSSGANQLASGTATLATGVRELSTSLNDATGKIPDSTSTQNTDTAKAIANPLLVDQKAVTEAQNYGAGLAPFFLSLAAWIGMYALFLIIRPLSRRALTAVRRPIRTTLAGWFTPAVLGVVQMIALFLIVTLVLHLTVANGLGMLAFLAFTSITFAAIILALNVLLGSVGQFLGLILMVVQLVTAGGTFPWQTLPGPLRALHEALPMSHAVDGVRQLMYGGPGNLWSAALPLLAWLVGALVVSCLGALRQGRFRTLRELRPSPLGA
ncbi:YhgE/Pip domain-containing protein [Glaciihabitans sp. UYNi722]|uniref:YhgE/Pip domain-containing protein n=1 Tax=Glaciihabitans sp. UYNi722 TaxID=3156344 RepID=UPI00339347A7